MKYRLPTSDINLPNRENELSFPLNGISDNIIFNEKLQLLIENFEYLLDVSNIVDNRSPQDYSYVYSFDDTAWASPASYASPSDPPLHQYNYIEVVDMYNGQYLYICAKTSSIDFYIGGDIFNDDNTSLTLKVSYDTIKEKGVQKFKDISMMKYNDEKLYVYDSVYGSIIVYDILSLLYSDTAIDNIKFVRQFTQVKNIISFDFDSSIYAITYDSIIIMNKDLNIISKASLNKNNPNDILVKFGKIIIIYDKSIEYYDKSLNYTNSVNINTFDSTPLLSIRTSDVNEDIVYLVSKTYIYKYEVGDDVLVGYIDFGVTRDKDYVNLSIKDTNGFDEIFILDENKLHYVKDKIVKEYLYDQNNLLDRINIDNLRIEDLELEQDIVYNTVFQKLLFNNILLYNSLIYTPVIESDNNGFLNYSHKKNLTNSNAVDTKVVFFGQNEVFSHQLFSRGFNSILDIQKDIINLLKYDINENSTNTLII